MNREGWMDRLERSVNDSGRVNPRDGSPHVQKNPAGFPIVYTEPKVNGQTIDLLWTNNNYLFIFTIIFDSFSQNIIS